MQKKPTKDTRDCGSATVIGNSLLQYLHYDLITPSLIAEKFADAETKCWINVAIGGQAIPLCTEPTYLDV